MCQSACITPRVIVVGRPDLPVCVSNIFFSCAPEARKTCKAAKRSLNGSGLWLDAKR